ncbi:DUF5709 domain-containing protein [Embleya sp. NPDC055664]
MSDDTWDPVEDSPDTPGDDGVLGPEDTLSTDDLSYDPLDTGIVPPDRWSAAERYGNTPEESRRGESLDQLLAEEEPDIADDDAVSDEWEGGPDPRAGRLVATDEGAHEDTESEAIARDVGIDGGAAGAEEAAMHVIPEEEVP